MDDAATRPSLADVIGVLVIGPSGPPVVGRWPVWAYNDPTAALEALVARGLLPPHWTDAARAPRWWCDDHDPRDEDHDAPPSLPALISVAALGADALARAGAIVAETWRGRALVWRVMTASEILRHHEVTARDGDGVTEGYVFSHEHERKRRPKAFGGTPAWPVECPWTSLPTVAPAWPALRELDALGLHLLACDAARVVLGVESVGAEGRSERRAA